MQWARLCVGFVVVLLSSVACSLVARNLRACLVLGLLFLLVSLPSHLYYTWSAYPVWYHAVYLLSIIPVAWAGGRVPLAGNTTAA